MMMKNLPAKKISYVFLSLICLLFAACQAGNGDFISSQKNKIQQEKQPAIELSQKTASTQGQYLPVSAQAVINQKIIIDLEVAQTPQQQSKGLMFREALADNRGMFFPFREARLTSFWMYQVPVSLDMVFLKQQQKSDQSQNKESTRKVIEIANSVPPCNVEPKDCPTYGPDALVDGVIELRAGRAKELGLSKGDSVTIKFLDPVK